MPLETGSHILPHQTGTPIRELQVRRAISAWAPGTLSWSTQFNDLRSQKKLGGSLVARQRALLRELKLFGIFERQMVIRDADVVNSLPLLHLITGERSPIRPGIVDGVYTLGLRRGASSFSEVNHQAGENRAYPKRYLETQRLVETLDQFLKDESILIADIDSIGKDAFGSHLRRLLKSGLLLGEEGECLADAIEQAKALGESDLRFGSIYAQLSEMMKASNADRHSLLHLIRWCRAAHVLTVPSDLGLPVTSSDKDLRPAQVSFILARNASEEQPPALKDHIFPKGVLTDDFLERMTIADMLKYRDRGFRMGYFSAADKLQVATGAAVKAATHEYLRALEEYMIAIAADGKAELVDLEKELAQRKVDLREFLEMFAATAIPVVIGGASLLTTHTPLGAAATAAMSTGVSLLNLGRYLYRQQHKVPLKRLIEGSTHTAPPRGRVALD